MNLYSIFSKAKCKRLWDTGTLTLPRVKKKGEEFELLDRRQRGSPRGYDKNGVRG